MRNIKLGKHDLRKIASEIADTFPNETIDTYCTADIKPTGILYKRYYNSNNNTSNYLKRKHEETMNTTSEDNLLFTNVEIESDEFVRGNSNIQLNDLLPHWRLGMKIRQSYINSNVDLNLILDKYEAYSRSDGYQLINDDFKSLFSDVNFEHKFLEVLPN
ncbi:hypothetical protein PVAND_008817 [Polypedilum vanderplanki]|uniref:Uncharacterized protein n=1 Tax=Polypedilum vanderplanki TaxID=319348 RepID=A0A9J6CBF2_POLVA|nr:hypothetical protein PVAND_008817 [Polypedilum vanderplanki]